MPPIGSIGDELFQLAHTRIGTLRIREQTFRYTLAAALLGETMLEGLATIVDGQVQPLTPPSTHPILGNDGRIYPGWSPVSQTPVAAYLHAAMVHGDRSQAPRTQHKPSDDGTLLTTWKRPAGDGPQRLRTVRTWLDYIAIWAYDVVSLRLVNAGQVTQVPFIVKRGIYHEPTHPQYDLAGIRIAHDLSSRWVTPSTGDIVLAALLSLAGLLDEVLVYPERANACRKRLATLISDLPDAYTTLVREAKAALDGKVLAAR